MIDIGDWSWDEDQQVTVETGDFDKAQIIQEFIEFQKDHGWAVDYEAVFSDEEEETEDENETVEDEEYEEYEIGESVEDEDGLVWQRVA